MGDQKVEVPAEVRDSLEPTQAVLLEVYLERERQDARWGQQDHPMGMDREQKFQAALATGNREALAVEIESRLRASHNCYGTSFKREPNGPCVWTKPLWLEQTEPPWRQWAEEAAAVLIGGAR